MAGTRARGILIDPESLEVATSTIGALPVVNAVLDRLGFDELLSSYMPEPDCRCLIEPARAIGVLVRNLAISRQPLYGLASWAATHDGVLLGLDEDTIGRLNDDRVGRALDELFSSDRASLLTALSLRAIRRYRIDVSELHNDSTSITLYGAYQCATGTPRGGVSPPVPERGFSKDHRGDLLQLVEILTISADGAIPLAHRLADGSTEDSTTHIRTWDELVALLGGPNFTYVADSKLATRDNMDHIAGNGGRFLTVLPKTRREDGLGRAWIASGETSWHEIIRRPGRRKLGPPVVYWAVEAPNCSAEGYRIVWMRSSDKRHHDAVSRADRIERAQARLGELHDNLSSNRSKLKTKAAVEAAVAAIVKDTGTTRWLRTSVTDTVAYEHRQEGRGRPGRNTRYRRIEHHRFALSVATDVGAIAYDAASDGCFPFVTNEKLSADELLRIYKVQPHLERRHATFKGVIEAAPIVLKSNTRIDALGFCLYVALLVHALVERELRRAMAARSVRSLPLYYEDRACAAPTAARIFELLGPLSTTRIVHAGEVLSVSAPTLDPLQRQILTLLKIPHRPTGHSDGYLENHAEMLIDVRNVGFMQSMERFANLCWVLSAKGSELVEKDLLQPSGGIRG